MSSIEKASEKLKNSLSTPKSRKPRIDHVEKRQDDHGDKSSIINQASASASKPMPSSSKQVKHPILPILEKTGMLTPAFHDKRQAEEYRQIKRPLLSKIANARDYIADRRNVIMITSALPGEGKTYTTINLAMSIALERDLSVLVVDCDVIKHSLSTFFGLDKQPGLIDYLEGNQESMYEMIIGTDVPSLSILPAGNVRSDSTELLSSDEMGRVMEEMAGRYQDRIIIFDSPPLLLTSQSEVLTNHAGQILVVIEEGVTPQKAVLEAISKLDSTKDIGCVLNKRSHQSFGEHYGGYYGNYG